MLYTGLEKKNLSSGLEQVDFPVGKATYLAHLPSG